MSQRWRHYDRMAAHLAPAAELLWACVEASAGTVIDVGSGSGNGLQVAAAAGRSAIGLDLAAEQLAAARTIGLPLVRGDVTALPVRPGSAAGAVSNFAIIFAHDRHRAMAEVARSLRAGARFAFTAWTADGWPQPARQVLAERLDRQLPPFPTELGELAAARAVLSDAGFGPVHAEEHELIWSFADVDAAVDELSEAAGGLRLLRRALEERGCWADAVDDLRAVLAPRCVPSETGVTVSDRYVLYVAEVE